MSPRPPRCICESRLHARVARGAADALSPACFTRADLPKLPAATPSLAKAPLTARWSLSPVGARKDCLPLWHVASALDFCLLLLDFILCYFCFVFTGQLNIQTRSLLFDLEGGRDGHAGRTRGDGGGRGGDGRTGRTRGTDARGWGDRGEDGCAGRTRGDEGVTVSFNCSSLNYYYLCCVVSVLFSLVN